MKKLFPVILLILFFSLKGYTQTDNKNVEGEISYISSENIYARFKNTNNINVGDTIFLVKDGRLFPAFIAKQKSSTSIVGTKITNLDIKLGDQVSNRFIENTLLIPKESEPISNESADVSKPVVSDTLRMESNLEKPIDQTFRGRVSLTSFANVYSSDRQDYQAFRASMSFDICNINGSDFSALTYMTYRHRYGVDQQNRTFFDDYKIYALAGGYTHKKINIWLGRKINQYIANVGAIDGLQLEYTWNKVHFGTFGGTRPDIEDYTFNPNLVQFGAYAAHDVQTSRGVSQTSLAFANQLNSGLVDRRFLYFQHNNSGLVKNLNIFISSEVDLFSKVNGEVSNKASLTGLYLMARYRLFKNLNVSAAYDNRRNVIYYESYQNFIDQLLAQETRRGWRFQVNYSPFKKININASTFLRYQGDQAKPTINHLANINFSRFPFANSSINLNANYFETSYHKAWIVGGRYLHYIFKNKAQLELNYRQIRYNYTGLESGLIQNVLGSSLSFNVFKYTSLMVNYEGTFQIDDSFHRYYLTIVQRFKHKKK